MRPLALALVLASALALHARPCRAQDEDALASARRLFTEAVADEDARRYEPALDKFRRVAAVKETANVLYRIASCLDALGRRAEAVAAYDSVVRLGSPDPPSAAAVQASRSRATQLELTIARLAVRVPADAPADTEVQVDDAPIGRAALDSALPVEPGRHTLRATASGRRPFDTAVQLEAGGRVTIAITLPPVEAQAPSPPPASLPSPAPSPRRAPAPPAEAGPEREVPAGAWIAAGVGGALAVGSIASFVLRSGNLATLDRDCRATASGSLSCPAWTTAEVNGAHDAAKVEGPLGIGLAAGAAAAFGVGAWLFFGSPARSPSALVVAPAVSRRTAGIFVQGALELF